MKNWQNFVPFFIIGSVLVLFVYLFMALEKDSQQRIKDNNTVVTIINTDKGTFSVYDRFSYFKDSPVFMERRKSGKIYVCIKEPVKQCNRIAE